MSHKLDVLIIDDDSSMCSALTQLLQLEGYKPQAFPGAEQALSVLGENWFGVIISDINMPNMDGIEFLQKALIIDRELPVIMLTGQGDISMAVEAMRLGAYDFLEKPFVTDNMLGTLKRAFERRDLVLENRRLKDEVDAQSGPGLRLLGKDEKIAELRRSLMRIKDAPANVLVFGETGTGKELVARFLHDHSERREGNFVALNCGAIPDAQIETELFGQLLPEQTRLKREQKGLLLSSHNGTLFLDEVESMSESMQVSLLRFLEERSVQPLGSSQSYDVKTHVLAATKVDLSQWVEAGKFRQDLYYRLNVIQVSLPPLRDRREDIGLLFENFVRVASARYGLAIIPRLTPVQSNWLKSHNWPGNVRELRNIAERFVLMGDKSVFDSDALSSEESINLSLSEQLKKFEKTLLQDALTQCNGRLKAVQRQLELPRKTLYEKMRKYGLEKSEYKE